MSIDWMVLGFYPWVFAIMMGLHCLIGMTAAIAAQKQGRPFVPWIFWGLLGGSVALMAVFLTSPKPR